jgi:ABC-2 type transport system permease protein
MAEIIAPSGAIHDIGYQRYRGERLGRSYIRKSLYAHGLRTAFGFGRSGKAKMFPWFVVGVLLLVAIIMVVIRSQTGLTPTTYVGFTASTSLLPLLFLATCAPELVSRDLRSKVLPLYFSRPLGRTDYAFAKLAALISAAWLILAMPLTVMFAGAAFSLPAHKIWHEFTQYLQGLAGAAILAIVYSVVALLIASLLNRRMVAAAAIVAVFLVTSTVGNAISVLVGGNGDRIGRLLGPQPLVQALNQWLFLGDPKDFGNWGWIFMVVSAALVAACVALLSLRYRKVSA